MLLNIDTKSYINNKTLLNEIINGDMDCLNIAFLPPNVIHPEKWIQIIIKNEKNEMNKHNNIDE